VLSFIQCFFVNDLHLLHPLSASEHTIILGDFNVNRNTTPSLYEKVVQHLCKSFTNTEALDEGERYNNTILIDVKDVCILISINSAIGSLTTRMA
jgi:hypothetical protein